MKTKFNRAFKYAGNKLFLIDNINQKINKKFDLYFEPFLGSGAIFYNLDNNKFVKYIINDYDYNIYLIHHAIKTYTYNDFINVFNEIEFKFR